MNKLSPLLNLSSLAAYEKAAFAWRHKEHNYSEIFRAIMQCVRPMGTAKAPIPLSIQSPPLLPFSSIIFGFNHLGMAL